MIKCCSLSWNPLSEIGLYFKDNVGWWELFLKNSQGKMLFGKESLFIRGRKKNPFLRIHFILFFFKQVYIGWCWCWVCSTLLQSTGVENSNMVPLVHYAGHASERLCLSKLFFSQHAQESLNSSLVKQRCGLNAEFQSKNPSIRAFWWILSQGSIYIFKLDLVLKVENSTHTHTQHRNLNFSENIQSSVALN